MGVTAGGHDAAITTEPSVTEPVTLTQLVAQAFASSALDGADGSPDGSAGLRLLGIEEGSTEARVLAATVKCAARWGLQKTTVDDIARTAGVSRATIYRTFPGGKAGIARLATRVEVADALAGLRGGLERAASLEDAVVLLLAGGAEAMEGHPALAYLREHDPDAIRAFLSFDRLEQLFAASGEVIGAGLERFLDTGDARRAAVWVARLVVSHYRSPDPLAPLSDPEVARRLARTFILPGLAPGATDHPMPGPAGSTPRSA